MFDRKPSSSSSSSSSICGRRGWGPVAVLLALVSALPAQALDYLVTRIDDSTRVTRDPVISETGLIAYTAYPRDRDAAAADVVVYRDGRQTNLTGDHPDGPTANLKPVAFRHAVAWTSTFRIAPPSPPPGNSEICLWTDAGGLARVSGGSRFHSAVSIGRDNLLAWQMANAPPAGGEIIVWQNGERTQVTTNRFNDLAPQVFGDLVVWYGWDGEDHEIFLYDHRAGAVSRVTSNRYDDVSPCLWGDTIVWEGYPAVEADVFSWSRGTDAPVKLSENSEDDLNPRIWGHTVVWQGFDGDDFEIWTYDLERKVRTKLTRNGYDDLQPEVRDGLIVWMGYCENEDAEIFLAQTAGNPPDTAPLQLTTNAFEDRAPRTAGGRVVWQADEGNSTPVYLAQPRPGSGSALENGVYSHPASD